MVIFIYHNHSCVLVFLLLLLKVNKVSLPCDGLMAVNDHDLNLSLGISTPSLGAGSSRNKNVEQPHLNYVHDTRRLQVINNPNHTLSGALLYYFLKLVVM